MLRLRPRGAEMLDHLIDRLIEDRKTAEDEARGKSGGFGTYKRPSAR